MTQDSSTYWKKSRVELRAAGFEPDRAAKTKAVVTIASAYTNAHRCNNRVRSITRPAGRASGRTRRPGPDRRRAGGVRCADSGHADGGLQPGVARRRRRLLRDRPLRPSRRCDDRDLGLRQDRRRRPDAARADQRVRAGALSGHQFARQGVVRRLGEQGHQPHDHGLRRGQGRRRVRPDLGGGAARARTQRDAGQRHLRRDVHGQHHEHDRRIDRHDAAARRLASGRLRCPERHPRRRPGAGARVGRRPVPADRGRHPAARYHDRTRLRECDHDDLRHGRLDQHVPAPAGHRARGPGADHHRAHPAGRRAGPAAVQPAAARQVRDGEPARDRRRAGRHEGAVARRPAAWRRHDRHRQDPGREPRRGADPGGNRLAGHRSSRGKPGRRAEQPYQRPERQSRAGELPAEAVGQDPGERRVPRHRARVRIGGRYDEGDPRRRDRARHRRSWCATSGRSAGPACPRW